MKRIGQMRSEVGVGERERDEWEKKKITEGRARVSQTKYELNS